MAADIDEIKTIVTNLYKQQENVNRKLNALAKILRVLHMHDIGTRPLGGEDYFKELLIEFLDDESIAFLCRNGNPT